jgi:hypothetical protein
MSFGGKNMKGREKSINARQQGRKGKELGKKEEEK